MRIEFESGKKKRTPRLRDLARIGDEEYTILSRSSQHLIQCCKRDDTWGYILEYQDGTTNDHYRALGGPIGLDRIIAAFAKYLNKDSSWQQDFTWGKLDCIDGSVQESVGPPPWNSMRDQEFEWFLCQLFEHLGYEVKLTKSSGDQGVDLIVSGDGRRIAVQAKGYANNVGNDAVAQVCAGMNFYECLESAVITNSQFTKSARDLAAANRCTLIDRRGIEDLIAGRHTWARPIGVRNDSERTRTKPRKASGPSRDSMEELVAGLRSIKANWSDDGDKPIRTETPIDSRPSQPGGPLTQGRKDSQSLLEVLRVLTGIIGVVVICLVLAVICIVLTCAGFGTWLWNAIF